MTGNSKGSEQILMEEKGKKKGERKERQRKEKKVLKTPSGDEIVHTMWNS